LHIEGLVRSLEVEFLPEAIEAALLRQPSVRRWARRFGFEGAMHALMAPVLLRLSRLDEFFSPV